MKGNDIREAYLSFFETKKEHLRLKSFPLIPKDSQPAFDRRRDGATETVFYGEG